MGDEGLEPDGYVDFGSCPRKYCILRELLDGQITPDDLVAFMSRKTDVSLELLNDVCDGCAISCTRKDVAARIYTQRELEQQRCVDDYRWYLEKRGRVVSHKGAFLLWIADGLAAKFAEAYQETCDDDISLRHSDLYHLSKNKL